MSEVSEILEKIESLLNNAHPDSIERAQQFSVMLGEVTDFLSSHAVIDKDSIKKVYDVMDWHDAGDEDHEDPDTVAAYNRVKSELSRLSTITEE